MSPAVDTLRVNAPLPTGPHLPAPLLPIRARSATGIEYRVRELDPLGAVVEADPGRFPTLGDEVLLNFEDRGGRGIGPIPAVVTAGSLSADGAVLRLRFEGIEPVIGLSILRFLRTVASSFRGEDPPIVEEDIVSPARIQRLVRALFPANPFGFVRDGTGRAAILLPVRIVEDGASPLWWRAPLRGLDPPFTVTLQGPFSVFELGIERFDIRGDQICTPWPQRIKRSRRRVWRRGFDLLGMEVAARHPIWPEVVIEGRVHDLSMTGLSVLGGERGQLLYQGLELPEVEVVSGPLAGSRFEAVVRHVTEVEDGGQCGLWVRHQGLDDQERWHDDVARVLCPNTVSGAPPVRHMWNLFADAGYLSLAGKAPKDFAPLRRALRTAVRRFDGARAIGVNAVWPSVEGADGSLTVVKMYHGTWFGQHMAKRKGPASSGLPGREVLREIHLRAYEHAQSDPDFSWVLGYVRADAGWPRLVHVQFPERCLPTGQSYVARFHARAIPSEAPIALESRYRIGPPNPGERKRILAELARSRPLIYREALDLVPDRLHMRSVAEAWTDAGLQRERGIRVARDGERAVAVAILEATSDGVHLYGLLDCARLYPLTDDGEDAFGALLAEATGWFHRRDRPLFVYKDEHGCVRLPPELGVREMGAADMTILPATLVPDLMEHLWEVTSPDKPRSHP